MFRFERRAFDIEIPQLRVHMAGIGRMVVDASEWVGQSYAHGILSGWISLFEAPVQWVFYQSYQFRDALSSASDNGCYQSARPSATDKSEPDFFRQVSEPTIRSGASRTIPRSKGSLGGDRSLGEEKLSEEVFSAPGPSR